MELLKDAENQGFCPTLPAAKVLINFLDD